MSCNGRVFTESLRREFGELASRKGGGWDGSPWGLRECPQIAHPGRKSTWCGESDLAILCAMGMVSDADLALARRLPEEYLSRPGEPEDRLIELINCHWGGYDAIARAQLAQALLPLLLDMANRRDADLGLYQGLCEGVVATWLRRQTLTNNRAG